jgi:hypothetical protein
MIVSRIRGSYGMSMAVGEPAGEPVPEGNQPARRGVLMQESRKKPPTTADEQAVLAVLHAVLDAMEGRDRSAMRALLAPLGWAVHSRDGRVFHARLWDLFDRLPEEIRVEERIYDPFVRIDDDIAMVWCAYDVYHDGEPHHWGTNIVTFMKSDGRWRICGITDNGRTGPRPLDLPAAVIPTA